MVYRRSFRRSFKRPFRRYARKAIPKRTVRSVKRVVRKVLGQYIEPACSDQVFNTAIVQGTPQFNNILVTGIADSANSTEMQTKRIHSIRISGTFENADVTTDHYVRVMIVHDKRPDQSAVAIGDILTTEGISKLPQFNMKGRFTIMRDKVLKLTGSTEGSYSQTTFKYFKRVPQVMRYWLDGATWRPQRQYYMVLLSDDAAGGITNNINVRVVYTDA